MKETGLDLVYAAGCANLRLAVVSLRRKGYRYEIWDDNEQPGSPLATLLTVHALEKRLLDFLRTKDCEPREPGS